jgi:hypothetical protein
MRMLSKALLRVVAGVAAVVLAGGVYAETHRVPGQP